MTTITEPTMQEAYERIREYFTQPGAQFSSVLLPEHTYPTCRYRAVQPDGTVTRCAVGCLFDDDQYAALYLSGKEGKTAPLALESLHWSNDLIKFLEKAQRRHDQCSDDNTHEDNAMGKFIYQLDQLALNAGLEVLGDE